MIKRAFDLIVSIAASIVTLPLWLFIAVGVKLSSAGPVLFKQQRVGRFGKPFTLYKFRSMRAASVQPGPCISTSDDPRITRFGQYLRASKMDELPQLINVIKGDMSLVGPRPEVPEIVKLYTPEQAKVLSVRPGLVGPAQIIGRSESSMFPKDVKDPVAYYVKHILPDKLVIDLEYAKQARLLSDIKLLFRGVYATIAGSLHPSQLKNASCWPYLFYADLLLALAAYYLAYMLRFEGWIPPNELKIFWSTVPIVFGLRLIGFIYFKLYRTYYKYLSLHDLIRMVLSCSASSLAIVFVVFFAGQRVHSRSIFIIDWILLVGLMGGLRILLRLWLEKPEATSYKPKTNVLIIGAGDLGETLARDFFKNASSYQVVGFIDDNPAKIGTTIHGVRVHGNRQSIPIIAKTLRADEALIAINNISSENMESILDICHRANLRHRVVPAMSDLVNGKIRLSHFRKVEVADLLGRTPLKIDFSAIEQAVRNKRILITGAGGSIGSELTRQVAGYHPEKLILLDRSENYLFELQEDFKMGDALPSMPIEYIIADITNAEKMERIFAVEKPEVIFHTAAQKHVPLSERNPDEAVINNIIGTQTIAMIADQHLCHSFIAISTDKAVKPSSVMGATKRVAELYLKSFSEYSQTRFLIVRFGNVLNSHGSVVPLFMKQIENGGPVRITDPNMERFFMTIPEAVNLVLQAMIMGRSGDIFILNMGKSVKIETLALNMIKLAGLMPRVDIDIEYTHMRPGEKLYEELVSNLETTVPTAHSMISKIIQTEPLLDYPEYQKQVNRLARLARGGRNAELFNLIKLLVPELPIPADLLQATGMSKGTGASRNNNQTGKVKKMTLSARTLAMAKKDKNGSTKRAIHF